MGLPTIADGTSEETTISVSWVAPDDRGSVILEYAIELKAADDSFHEEETQCSGSEVDIFASLMCKIQMTTFVESPYLLSQGDPIVAQVRARNAFGWGDWSDPNSSGAIVQQRPQTPPSAPELVSQAETSITVKMPDVLGANTGGSVLLSYNLLYNMGGNSENYVSISG